MADSKQYDALNHTQSDSVEPFLSALREGRAEDALQLLQTAEICIVDKSDLNFQKELLERVRENSDAYLASLTTVKDERDVMLKGVASIYKMTAFIFDSIKDHETAPIAKWVPGLTAALRTFFGFSDLDDRSVNTIGRIVFRVKGELPQLKESAPHLVEEVTPALEILNKYKIIISPTLQTGNNGSSSSSENQE